MALTPQDVSRIAHLARLELSGAEQVQMPLTSEVVWRALRGEFAAPLNLPA